MEKETGIMIHICKEGGCMCGVLALDPSEDCPVHGFPRPRCAVCGRFLESAAEAFASQVDEEIMEAS